jgi:NAD(P)-dependent dehydrogenase (short-subunit alcohol dehydrogenase family)
MTERFAGKRVLVTGGATGIGRATVLAFAREGAQVVASGRREDRLRALQDESGDPDVHALVADVGSPLSCRQMVAGAIELLGGLDVLVNNAGVSYMEPFLEATEERWRETIDVNLSAPFYASQAAAAHMVDHGGGAIVNVASIDAFVAESPSAHYMASKAGLVNLTRSIAFELGHRGVRCNAVCPGHTRTPMTEGEWTAGFRENYLRRIPMRRFAEPGEQASVVLFLASDEASYVNGETITVDGGQLTGFWYYPEDEPPVPASG